MEDRNKAVARAALFDYLNRRDFKRFEEIHTKDFLKHYNNSPAESLSEEMRDAKGQYDSSSDLTFTENWMIAEGDKVVTRLTGIGKHEGDLPGAPRTGNDLMMTSITIHRIANGKLVEKWSEKDVLGFLIQLGVMRALGQQGV